MNNTLETGKQGEEIAVKYLIGKGYNICERNWYNSHQELDIIASKDNLLVIVEVKSRMANPVIEPQLAVTRNKQRLLIKAANAYIERKKLDMETRFDIIAIIMGEEPKIEHIENAFYPLAVTRF